MKLLLNHQINKERWNEIIREDKNGRIYATSIWLDAMSPNWSALIKGDYEYMMPLTWKKKWGISYLAQPPFTQQLGIFSNSSINPEISAHFFEEAKKRFKFGEIFTGCFEENPLIVNKICKNYILDLSIGYEKIKTNYTRDLLKKNLQRVSKFNLKYLKSTDINNTVDIYEQLYGDRTPNVTETNYKALKQLGSTLQKVNTAFVREVRMPNDALLACGLFFKDDNRIYNIASTTLPDGRTFEANHFLFDELIKEFAGSRLILDFEGSDLPGVERFYKKFGPIMEPYFFNKWNNLPWPIKLLK